MPTLLQIGDLVERTGLTHRALHYYDEIGLLTPSYRLEGGMRLYTEDDLRRLDRILEWRRQLGLSLHEIKEMLEAEEARARLLRAAPNEPTPESRRADLQQALAIAEQQLARAQERLKHTRQLVERLEAEIAVLRTELAQPAVGGRGE